LHPYPHTYAADAAGDPVGLVAVSSTGLPQMQTAPPPQFDGPGGLWSPETLLCAALADCFVLTFRAVSRAAQLNWLHLECSVVGRLERVDRVSQFTQFTHVVKLTVPPGTDVAAAHRLVEQAEHACLIANSLRGARTLTAEVLTY
jgi:organic hydroperoxide reductase OsmC/OhrA